MDALDGGTVLLFLDGRAAVFAGDMVGGASPWFNRVEIGNGPSPYRTGAASGLVAHANRGEHRDPYLLGCAAGAGVA
jgi:hypothetical protein